MKPNIKSTWLADTFDWLGESFERFNPAAFRFLAAFLPYSTPFPVAWLTAQSAEEFLHFTPAIAFIFVFGLEGMGLWFTSLFMDAVIDWIISRNAKTSVLVLLFGLVVAAYVYLLVNLNVTLKINSGESNQNLERVITLLCFLPLLTGIGNGYYKWKLDQEAKKTKSTEVNANLEEFHYQNKREDRLKSKMIKAGMNPTLQFQSVVESIPLDIPKDDWRVLSPKEKHDIQHNLSVKEIMKKYGVSRATAYNWKAKSV